MKNNLYFYPLALVVTTILLAHTATAQPAATPSKDQRMQWWRQARFGLFIHWGLYAIPAGAYKGNTHYGEWIMEEAQIPVAEYEQWAPQFNPTAFNAADWVSMAKQAGMKYLVITSKHHDGFCLWPSAVSNYDVEDRTPFKRDILGELATECRRQGRRFGLYYSIMDWHHPQAKGANFAQYREQYMKPQLQELLQRYTPDILWFDGEWIKEWTEEQGVALYNWLLLQQPNLIINNRIGKGRQGMQGMTKGNAVGDFGTPEQEILAQKTSQDWESCMTMNNHWGYNAADTNWKSATQLIWNLIDVVSKGGNYLLNVGPMANGQFPEACVERLAAMGSFMQQYGHTIYPARPWEQVADGDGVKYATNPAGGQWVYLKSPAPAPLYLRKLLPKPGTTLRPALAGSRPLHTRPTPNGLLLPSLPAQAWHQGVMVLQANGLPQTLAPTPQIGSAAEAKAGFKVITSTQETLSIAAPAGTTVYYTTNGSTPTQAATRYTGPIPLKAGGLYKAVAYQAGAMPSEVATLQVIKGKYRIQINQQPARQYSAAGPVTLVDGQQGSPTHHHKDWLGFEGVPLQLTMDLGRPQAVHSVTLGLLQNHGAWIFLPRQVELYGGLQPNELQALGSKELPAPTQAEPTLRQALQVQASAAPVRYLQVRITPQGICPPWHAGNGAKAWLFIDEVAVN